MPLTWKCPPISAAGFDDVPMNEPRKEPERPTAVPEVPESDPEKTFRELTPDVMLLLLTEKFQPSKSDRVPVVTSVSKLTVAATSPTT